MRGGVLSAYNHPSPRGDSCYSVDLDVRLKQLRAIIITWIRQIRPIGGYFRNCVAIKVNDTAFMHQSCAMSLRTHAPIHDQVASSAFCGGGVVVRWKQDVAKNFVVVTKNYVVVDYFPSACIAVLRFVRAGARSKYVLSNKAVRIRFEERASLVELRGLILVYRFGRTRQSSSV
eukprot:CAMPEP_0171810468 /NCGR_PEP_ID=MMETSP0991-20121206/77570_1 /TAXON_ID=483369 /ORGANISM="non described non described, Strain CCMP2098" /LENGTH=173 /DNA_ID=CAMNT_0012423729 /DNA_START=252 /DNA_END=773 /DNA_ORIENTATION=+